MAFGGRSRSKLNPEAAERAVENCRFSNKHQVNLARGPGME